MSKPIITAIELTDYTSTLVDFGTDYNGFNQVYQAGSTLTRTSTVLQIHTDVGLTGEYLTGAVQLSTLPMFLHYLLGKPALERERIYQDVKRALRQQARVGMAAIDVALWDLAGKYYNAPIYELLGGHVRPLKCYASTTHGDDNGGLNSPEAYADFAQRCQERGYPAFKIHGWGGSQVEREIATIRAVRARVGEGMDLMLDPACELETFADAVKVGRACDDARFYWLEDPYKDGGISQFAHRKLRQLVRTPLLQTEHVRTLEPHVDFALADATDFLRGDVGYDGITGVVKLAHAAEGLGLDIEMHGPGPAQRHLMSSVRNTNYYEMGLLHPCNAGTFGPGYTDYADGFDAVDAQGCVYVPQGPGLGVTLDWDYIHAHTTAHLCYR
ncbi:MAG: enolase C-terminal domain-like protein [Anaerolineae bacterium]|jgi:L-alanine-DL-glutamate epimerase-like enolase superfamily enzyme|nr:mandelate racemase [Chloroflexota bacterium]